MSDHVGPLCPECPDGLRSVEGMAEVYWVDGSGKEIYGIDESDDPSRHPELTKMVYRECPECGTSWKYEVN